MKKILFSLTVLFSITTICLGQSDKGYIGISIGPSTPMGDLASKDANNLAAGWATSGAVFDISFNYKLGESNFGIAALLRGQANATDAQELANEFASQIPGVLWTVDSEPWSMGGLLFGGYASFPVSNKFSFDTKAMFGFLSATSPEITITGSNQEAYIWVNQNSATVSSFAYSLGAGFKYELGRKMYILSNVDYLASNPEFLNVQTIASDGSMSSDTWSQKMGTLNMSFGIAYKL